ncbi:hypothetical protein [Eubacterium limosum]|uniref:HEPN AbiU2-like domain-containing protein n=1 Tax=Eubacterium limosum TaxID=1736 RepID=A0ABT5UUY8_EUBLI|nr:hypothetical protein [Eubacterium limosum]MDE1472787.1 hypothetical protein [Eubacterium limosum]
MIELHRDLSSVKDDIEKYLNLIFQNNKEFLDNNDKILRSIVKNFLFLRQIDFCGNEELHYGKCMIFDVHLTLHSLNYHSKKFFFTSYRSFIENSLRFILNFSDNDETGIRDIFKKVREKYSDEISARLVNYFNGEYGKCCNAVHSNIKSNIAIYEYYVDFLENDKIDQIEMKKILNQFSKFLQELSLFWVVNESERIDSAFYKEKYKLRYLLSEKNYALFKQKSSAI